MTVVCAGPKSILDVGRTLEALETRGVPVVAWQSDEVAGFYSRSSGHRAPSRVDSAAEAARLIATHRRLGLTTGLLITVPLPDEVALPPDEVAAAVDQAEAEAAASGIHGPASTPFILSRVAELTTGRSVRANLALVEQQRQRGRPVRSRGRLRRLARYARGRGEGRSARASAPPHRRGARVF